MDYVIENDENVVPGCLDLYAKFVADGAKRFAVWGGNEHGASLIKALKNKAEGASGREIIGVDKRLAQSKNDRTEWVMPQQMDTWKPDVIFIVIVREWLSARNDLDQLLYLVPNVVYVRRPPRKTLLVSITKSGTHLVSNVLSLLGMRRNNKPDDSVEDALSMISAGEEEYVLTHGTGGLSVYDIMEWASAQKVNVLFNYRDPRDTALSTVNYYTHKHFTDTDGHFKSDAYKANSMKWAQFQHRDTALTHCLEQPDLPLFYRVLAPLKYCPSVCSIQFEDLIGPEGGGEREKQERAILRIMRTIGVGGNVKEIAKRTFDKSSPTFFQGKSGVWRTAYNHEHRKLFEDNYAGVLETYGYQW